jgi:hypothetical protein
MKSKILVVGVFAFVSIFATSTYAVGQNNNAKTNNQDQQENQVSNQGEESQIQARNNEQVQLETANGVQSQQQAQIANNGEDTQNHERYQNTVSSFVKNLLEVADREGGIGEQVRTIANQQNQSAEKTIQAMEQIQTRSKVKTFFIGSDYKNLGMLRSEIVQTRNRLEQLNKIMENVQNEGDKTELQNQIDTLKQEQTKIENFIKDDENKFSIFGWFVKLFNK